MFAQQFVQEQIKDRIYTIYMYMLMWFYDAETQSKPMGNERFVRFCECVQIFLFQHIKAERHTYASVI